MRTLTDAALASIATLGDRRAFGELMRRHAGSVRTLLRRMGAPAALADDIAQDACLKAFERIASYRSDGPFSAWLNRIAARMFIRQWRTSKASFTDELDETVASPLPGVAAATDQMDLEKGLECLNAAERMCVSLCYGLGMSHSEAAEELQLPIGTVKSHVHRGLTKLRRHFAADLPTMEQRRARA